MRRFWTIVLNVLSWAGIIAYFVFSSRYAAQKEQQTFCRDIRVAVLDSARMNFITSGMVKAWFATEGMQLTRQEISQINTRELEQFVTRRGYVKNARVYTSMDGVLNVELTQRRPLMRVSSVNGYNFYVTEDNYVLPLQRHFVEYVPVVTGIVEPPFPRDFVGSLDDFAAEEGKKVSKNYLFLVKLINFVKFVNSDRFWNSFVVQINVRGTESGTSGEPEVEIVPRIGNQIVLLGGLDGYETKLDKLMSFYKNGLAYEGWERYSYINLNYQGQVVCTK